MSHYFLNDNKLKDEPYKFISKVGSFTFTFETNSGVFAKRGLDFGTRTLIETLLKENISGDVLDIGCGYGPVGIVLAKHFNVNVDLSDVNVEGLELVKSNLKANNVTGNVILSDAYDNVKKQYDYIITNPPIRAGKKKVYEIILGAKDHLKTKTNSELWIVIRKEQGAKSLLKDITEVYRTEIITKNKGFYVIKCHIR